MVQVKQDRQTVFRQPEQKRTGRQAGSLYNRGFSLGSLFRLRPGLFILVEFRLDFLVCLEGEEKLVRSGHRYYLFYSQNILSK
jgi:hypothetical protein